MRHQPAVGIGRSLPTYRLRLRFSNSRNEVGHRAREEVGGERKRARAAEFSERWRERRRGEGDSEACEPSHQFRDLVLRPFEHFRLTSARVLRLLDLQAEVGDDGKDRGDRHLARWARLEGDQSVQPR